jgi:hypothetical protein
VLNDAAPACKRVSCEHVTRSGRTRSILQKSTPSTHQALQFHPALPRKRSSVTPIASAPAATEPSAVHDPLLVSLRNLSISDLAINLVRSANEGFKSPRYMSRYTVMELIGHDKYSWRSCKAAPAWRARRSRSGARRTARAREVTPLTDNAGWHRQHGLDVGRGAEPRGSKPTRACWSFALAYPTVWITRPSCSCKEWGRRFFHAQVFRRPGDNRTVS